MTAVIRKRRRRGRPNPFAIGVGDRVVFADHYRTGDGARKPVAVRGIVVEIEWKSWPGGMVYIDVDMQSLPAECRPWARDVAAVQLADVRHDKRRAM